jgi:branched-subunit amino acid transport protein
LAEERRALAAMQRGEEMPSKRLTPFAVMVANGALHCGSGCTLGDIIAEWLVFAVPAIAAAFGWRRLFGVEMFAAWIVDYLFAYVLGIVFQYFTIVPMRNLSFGQGVIAAVKADTLSLTAWQAGTYGFMAIAYFVIFRLKHGRRPETTGRRPIRPPDLAPAQSRGGRDEEASRSPADRGDRDD